MLGRWFGEVPKCHLVQDDGVPKSRYRAKLAKFTNYSNNLWIVIPPQADYWQWRWLGLAIFVGSSQSALERIVWKLVSYYLSIFKYDNSTAKRWEHAVILTQQSGWLWGRGGRPVLLEFLNVSQLQQLHDQWWLGWNAIPATKTFGISHIHTYTT